MSDRSIVDQEENPLPVFRAIFIISLLMVLWLVSDQIIIQELISLFIPNIGLSEDSAHALSVVQHIFAAFVLSCISAATYMFRQGLVGKITANSGLLRWKFRESIPKIMLFPVLVVLAIGTSVITFLSFPYDFQNRLFIFLSDIPTIFFVGIVLSFILPSHTFSLLTYTVE